MPNVSAFKTDECGVFDTDMLLTLSILGVKFPEEHVFQLSWRSGQQAMQ